MDKTDLIDCGFGAYVDPFSGQYYEKTAENKIEPVQNERVSAQRRYVERHMKEFSEKHKNRGGC